MNSFVFKGPKRVIFPDSLGLKCKEVQVGPQSFNKFVAVDATSGYFAHATLKTLQNKAKTFMVKSVDVGKLLAQFASQQNNQFDLVVDENAIVKTTQTLLDLMVSHDTWESLFASKAPLVEVSEKHCSLLSRGFIPEGFGTPPMLALMAEMLTSKDRGNFPKILEILQNTLNT